MAINLPDQWPLTELLKKFYHMAKWNEEGKAIQSYERIEAVPLAEHSWILAFILF